MNELFTVLTPSAAFAELHRLLGPIARTEIVPAPAAFARVLAAPIDAAETLPAFARATMDGFAVRSRDTAGASDGSPAYLHLAGEIAMGSAALVRLGRHEALRIATGAMLPPDADGVVMVEDTNQHGDEIEVVRGTAPGENVVDVGEDVRRGDRIFDRGHTLRSQDLGALAALGIERVAVFERPKVAVLSTGDELVEVAAAPAVGQVRDVNSITVGTTIEAAGGSARSFGIVPDDEERLLQRAAEALDASDALVMSAGSSVSARDLTARVISRLGSPGVLVHGIALRPGKPTVVALCDGKPVIGLPGNPVSALVVAWRFVRPLVRVLAGQRVSADGLDDERAIVATATHSIPSRPGREDYVPASLERAPDGEVLATPIFGKSNLIFTLVRSNGMIAIPLDLSGVAAGARVRVILP